MTSDEPAVDFQPANAGSETLARETPVNPRLSAGLSANYDALQNDMEQARELAADFQRQLAGKSNEFAQLKQLFEKALSDLASLQAGIVELRAERHHLANEAMRGTAYQMKLKKVVEERDRLRVELEVVRTALAVSADEVAVALRKRDAEIAALIIEVVTLKSALTDARRCVKDAKNSLPPSPIAFDQERAPATSDTGFAAVSHDDLINISFDA